MGEYHTGLYLDRELSWLAFDGRILMEAADEKTPLLERLKFLSIFHSNLDEFFMVRVGSLTDRMLAEPKRRDVKTGQTAAEQLFHIMKEVRKLTEKAAELYGQICARLKQAGILILEPDHLEKVDALILQNYFNHVLRYQLSLQIVNSRHPFPFLKNKEQYMVILFDTKDGARQLGMIPLGSLPRFYMYELENKRRIAFTAEIVAKFAARLFRGQRPKEINLIRVTRSADLEYEESVLEEEADPDYRDTVETLLQARRRLPPVRLQFWKPPSPRLSELLCRQLKMEPNRVFTSGIPLEFSPEPGFREQLKLTPKQAEKLFYPPQIPVNRIPLQKGRVMALAEKSDLLLHFPYQTMQPFVQLLYDAGNDPAVISIQISLYRLANPSKIVAALLYAAEQGKAVSCFVELRARFDEQSNIEYTRILEKAGCRILYGPPGYKIHAKLCLITKKHRNKTAYLTQIGTGNYNEKTAELYTDLSLITADEQIGREAESVFCALRNGEFVTSAERLWVAPLCYRTRVLALIEAEIRAQRQSRDGYIAIKVNAMNDLEIMRKLVEASRAGVTVNLVIRGICCLRPGVRSMTEQITVKSIVGRYLEHSRIFCFGVGERQQIFIGSGDLLTRNTVRRVEVFVKILQPEIRKEILRILTACIQDDERGWYMNADGSYRKKKPENRRAKDSQRYLYESYRDLAAEPEKKRRRHLWGKIRKRKKPAQN